jgi:GNAT superfamily N-acetyltransferase
MIHKAIPEDAAGIARVHVDSWHETYPGLLADEAISMMTNYERRLTIWGRILQDANQSNFVALEDGKVVGFVNGGKAREEIAGYDGELYALYLLKNQHGKGLGRQLMQRFAQEMQEHGYKAFYLWVLPGNPTCAFYEHMGGKYLTDKSFELAGASYSERAYGWPDIGSLLLEEE